MHASNDLRSRSRSTAAATERRPPAPARSGAAQDPPGLAKLRIDSTNPFFVEHVRQAIRAETAESPVAAALLRHVGALPNPISVKPWHLGPAKTMTDHNGHVTLYINPYAMTGATLSHELGHVIQQANAHNALLRLRAAGRVPTGADMAAAIEAGRDALHQIVPVKDARDRGQEQKENEAMRISNIVNAERTATRMQSLPEHQKTCAEFRRRQSKLESAPQHQNNQHPLPPGSLYGQYPFGYVKQALGYDADGRKR